MRGRSPISRDSNDQDSEAELENRRRRSDASRAARPLSYQCRAGAAFAGWRHSTHRQIPGSRHRTLRSGRGTGCRSVQRRSRCPRLEFRFGDKFFRGNELASGGAWEPETAARLYERELLQLDLPRTIAPLFQRDEAKSALTATQFQTLRLWAHNEPFESLGSAATLKRHRAAIREALDIDIKLPPGPVLGHKPVAVRKVFDMQNAVGTDFDLDDADNEELVRRVLAAR